MLVPAITAPSPRVYWWFLRSGFRQAAAYPLATFGGLVANLTFGLLKATILGAAVAGASGTLAGYTASTMAAYVWLSQGLLGTVNLWGRNDLMDRIRTGDVTTDFLRPVSVQASVILTECGKGAFGLLPRGLPSVVLGLILTEFALPSGVEPYALGALSIVLGTVLSQACVYVLATAAFWVVETRGLSVAYMVVSAVLAGLYTPVDVFPGWLRAIAHGTPFPSMLMTPVDVLSGRVQGPDALAAVGVQVAWLGAALVVGAVLTRAGRRKLEVQGG